MFSRGTAALVFLLLGVTSQAEPYHLPSDTFQEEIYSHLQYLPEMSGERHAKTVHHYYQSRKHQQSFPSINDAPKYSTELRWFVLTIENSLQRDIDLLLDYRREHVRELEVYLFNEAQLQRSYQTGDKYPFISRPTNNTDYRFPIFIRDQQQLTLLIAIQGRPQTFIDSLYLLTTSMLYENDHIERRWDWLVFGALILMTIYIAIMFIYTRDKNFGWFLCWLICLQGFLLSNIGYAQQLFWVDNAWLQVRASNAFIVAANISQTIFAITFLGLKELRPRLVKLLHTLMVLIVTLEIVALAISQQYRMESAVTIMSICMLCAAVLIYAAISVRPVRKEEATVFLLALSIFLLAFIVESLMLLVRGWIANPAWTVQISLLAPTLVLSLAIGKKYSRIQVAQQKALMESQSKSEFLAAMSHEIRTPMNGMLGMSELLATTGLNKQQKRYNNIIRQSGETLLNIINDILDFSKIEAGKLELESIAVNMDQLIREVGDIFHFQIKQGRHVLLCEVDKNLPAVVITDPVRLQQILINLLGNAFKFSEEGNIVLSASRREGFIHFTIKDEGIGIAKDKQDQLFESFTQADTSTTRCYGGSGLGLSICSLLVKKMGGEIGLNSTLGKGSTFFFTIPLNDDQESLVEPKLKISAALQGKKLLLVDNSEVARDILRRWTDTLDFHVDIFNSPEEALQGAQQALEAGAPYDLISVDMHMPVMDGFELVERLRSLQGYMNTPVVMLTASGETPESSKLECSGVTKISELPLLCKDLLAIFNDLMEHSESSDIEPDKGSALQIGRAIHVLVVEDNPVNAIVVCSMLHQLGCSHDLVGNGAEAVASLRKTSKLYDLVLMDCEMPVMDGYQASCIIRNELANQLPIIALTAHTLKGYQEKCLEAGMNAVLIKPLSISHLRAEIENVL